MSIPKYDEMYRAFLDCLADGQPHDLDEIKSVVANKFRLSPAEREVLLAIGKQPVFDNRIGWCRTYLKKAGLLERVARGTYVLTFDGKRVLAENPAKIDNLYLQRFDSFRAFFSRSSGNEHPVAAVSSQTPQDTLEAAFHQINSVLEDNLLTAIMGQSPAFFEHLVVKLLTQMGYGGSAEDAGMVIGLIREDKLGFSLIYIQAKRWDRGTSIGRPEIQKFVGALAGQGASKGLFITTAKFTKEAREYANKQHTAKIVLVDGQKLAKLMIEYNLGVSTETTYQVKRIDTDFFSDDWDA